jgi:phage FluMu protein Com
MANELFLSREQLPPDMTRCPRCSTIHEIASSVVATPKSTGAKAALEAFLSEIGQEQVRLKCPKCGTTYETQTGVQPKHPSLAQEDIQKGQKRLSTRP